MSTEYCKARFVSASNTKGSRVSVCWLNGSSIKRRQVMHYDHRLNGSVDQMNHLGWSLMFHDGNWSYYKREVEQ